MVECTMEGDLHAIGSGNEALAELSVDCSITCQSAYHYAIDANLSAKVYVMAHHIGFGVIIDEIAFTRAYKNVDFDTGQTTCCLYEPSRWGKPVEGKGGTEFNAMRSSKRSSTGTRQVARADFKLSHAAKIRILAGKSKFWA